MSKFPKPSREMLIDAINVKNGLQNNPLTWDQIAAGFPEHVTTPTATRNTRLLIFGLKQGGYKGSVTVTYDRIDLEELFRNVTPLVLAKTPPKKLSDLLPVINTTYGLSLIADDIVDLDVSALGEDFIATVEMKQGCVAWFGSFDVRASKFLPKLQNIIIDNKLDVIVPPFTLDAKPNAEYFAYGYDFTDMKDVFATWSVNRVLTQDDIDQLNEIVPLGFINQNAAGIGSGKIALKGAKYAGIVNVTPTSLYDPAFTKAVRITMAADSGHKGTLILHYSPV